MPVPARSLATSRWMKAEREDDSRRSHPRHGDGTDRPRRHEASPGGCRWSTVATLALASIAFAPRRAPAQDAPAPATEVELRVETVDGERRSSLSPTAPWSIDGDVLTLGADRVPLADVLSIDFARPARASSGVVVGLRGGERIVAPVTGGDADAIRVDWAARLPVDFEVPLDEVRWIARPGAFEDDRALATFIERTLSTTSATDRLFLRAGDPIDGLAESFAAGGVRFAKEGESELLYPWDQIAGVQLATLEGATPETPTGGKRLEAAVHLVDTARVHGRLAAIDATSVTIDHRTLGTLRLALDAVAEIGILGGRGQFLSDLDPVAVDESLGALSRIEMPWRRDESVLATPLRIRGESYAKGIGVHAYSRLEFDVTGAKRFRATLGLDDTAVPPPGGVARDVGRVTFRVSIDDRQIFEKSLTYEDAPHPIDLDITGGRRLTLVVDPDGGGLVNARDRADWAHARIIRASP